MYPCTTIKAKIGSTKDNLAMNNIYILKKRKLLYGPYSLEIVKQKGLKQTDLVWYQGLNDWTPVDQLEPLAQFIVKKEQQQKQTEKTLFEKIFGFLN